MKKHTVGSYYYKSSDGQQFLVFAFSAYANLTSLKYSVFGRHIYCNYLRSAQIMNAVAFLGSEKLPAYSYGNPNLYILTKKNGSSMAVGLWNILPMKFLNRSSSLTGNIPK